jgi:histidinol-phosphate aminotransferase
MRFSNHLKDIPDYIPGKPIEEVERELGIKNAIKMASNENFMGPPPGVTAAIVQEIDHLNLYPDSSCYNLRQALSKKISVQTEQVLVGHGSNYLIDLICRCVLNPGDQGIIPSPSFLFYRRAILGAIGTAVTVPLRNFEIDVEDICKAVTGQTRLIFLGSPNNPTGRIIPFSRLQWLMTHLDREIFVVVDEAYFEYVTSSEAGTGLDLLGKNENLIILRTFSKIYSLAGLRLGFAVAHSAVIQALMKLFLPFSVGTLAQAAALAYLADETPLAHIRKINETGKAYLYAELEKMGIPYLPTEANFILLRVGKATKVYERLLSRGIIVRDLTPWNLPEYIRVTISLPEHNERLIHELRTILPLIP